ncbi:MAG TPA: ATP-binding protein, partial [Labilithrix sp.]|nr:ATP-binding protein [Labilithrix sp.]
PDRPPGPGLLVVELEPPVIETLRRDLKRIGIVAAAAASVLLAFAIAWSRSARRLSELEARAARDERLIALGSMSSVMAHELRNPLASLKGHAQLLLEDLEEMGDTKKRAKAERVVSEAERLERLTTTLLDFVRDGPNERTKMRPEELVHKSLEDVPIERVNVDLSSAPSTVEVDGGRLARAIHNLVDNALQAAPEESIELTMTTEGTDVVLTVRDRGPGIPAGSESQIFEPFMTTRVRGTGLGLAVARRIVEQHEGTLTGDNHPSGGAIFTLRLRGQRS